MPRTTTRIAGLEVHTYTTDAFAASKKPVVGLFVLHGRLGSSDSPYIQELIQAFIKAAETHQGEKDLLVISFDHRNHGTRLLDDTANLDFAANPRHALDMYAIQSGTAQDCLFLIGLLEAYLFPSGERTIVEWGVSGVSLGGHSAWIAGTDARVSTCIPIIGCPEYLPLMKSRAETQGVSVAPPQFPDTLLALIRADSEALDRGEAFQGKNLLVLSGGKDPVVPWAASEAFVEKVDVGNGVKKVVVYEDAVHEMTPGMVQEAVNFITQRLG
ncbi:Alpha/Beta hydrolase protein [Roridomyces roridus]|uniref:Alpha/Beta hydrolase protein n=1 Tax=Roridomyces roridus TaxID=1738132 RepID=A0AAD7CJQ1_9AGAR|nr:Alpha/Beta hydrolase protein [Roridomyces roridus]